MTLSWANDSAGKASAAAIAAPITTTNSKRHLLERRTAVWGSSTDPSPFLEVLFNADFLHGPGGAVALIDDMRRLAMDFVDQAGILAVAQAGLGPAQQLAVQVELIDFAAEAIAAVHILGRTRRDADAPRRAHAGDGFLQLQFGVVDLDAIVSAIADVDIVVGVGGDAVRRGELVGAGTVRADRAHPHTFAIHLGEARVAVAVADVDIVVRIPGHVGFAVE